ncbi:MAG: phytoene desaturase family protein, partial [Promethearchaeota archaeon]
PAEILKEHPWLARASGLTAEEFFHKFIKNKRLIAVLAQLWGYAGLPPSKLNALYMIIIIMAYVIQGGAFPTGRSHSLTSGIVQCFTKLGGEVRYNALVNRILVDHGKVCGVELLNGDVYLCKTVISNVNPICTTMKMLPPEVVPDDYKKRIYASEIGPSAFSVYLGLNISHKDLGLTAHETFLNKDDDLDAALESFKRLETPDYMVAACYNHVDETISPPGTTQLVLTTLQMGKLWHNVAPDQYHYIKDKISEGMIRMVEKTIIPDIRDYIEVAEAATPLTYYRYSKNMDGAIYGYVQDVFNSPRFRLNSKGAIPGLYLAGAWVNIGGGYDPCINSGRMAAGMCLNYLKKEGGS